MAENIYECFRCKYQTERKSVMKTHVNRKKKCNKTPDTFEYDDEYCSKISMIKKCNRKETEYTCTYCNKNYCNSYTLDKHMNEYCKSKELKEKSIINNTINNNNNTINNQNIINNFIIIPNMTNNIPIPFDKDWITEHINIHLKQLILLGENKYSNLLKNILENKNNLNVIIDKTQDIGFVYCSDNKYINMDKNQIIDMSMEKLYNQLNKIKDEVIQDSNYYSENTTIQSDIIEKKYNEYKTNKGIQKGVETLFTDIYEKNKELAIEFYKNFAIDNGENSTGY